MNSAFTAQFDYGISIQEKRFCPIYSCKLFKIPEFDIYASMRRQNNYKNSP